MQSSHPALRFRLPGGGGPDPGKPPADALLDAFLRYVEDIGLELYPAQEAALLEISSFNNVILNTPTGSGKSMVALAACFCALAVGGRAYYTAPIKALVNEKFLELCRVLGAENVGLLTGDASVHETAPVICCTAEILSNLALRRGEVAPVDWVIMDEFHYYSDRDRGVAWQVPLLTLKNARFLLMSATLGDTARFERVLEDLTSTRAVLVKSTERPVPLEFSYVETPLHETIQDLLEQGRAPIYIVHFAQMAASDQAQRLLSIDFLSREQKLALREELKGFRFDSAFGKELARFLPHGVGVHHAGMLPKYRLLVERLAQRGFLKVICGTDTLGVGINVPIRTVLFTQLCKYDGDKTKILSVRDFQQIAGRAGRRGFDREGFVVVQAPEHVVENKALQKKAAGDPKKLKKLHLKKPPEHGYAPWDETTMKRLIESAPETLTSRFTMNSGMLLSVLSRPTGGCQAMKRLLLDCHDTEGQKRKHQKTALGLFRAFARGGIIEMEGGKLRVHADLQEDFSLHHALSLYAVEALSALDPGEAAYPYVTLSIIESIVENPAMILKRQVDKLKQKRLLELKHEGVPFEERMEELEKVDYPRPEEEFLLSTFELFRKAHPWVLGENLAPKSIARDMLETGLTFHAYVKEYGLERSEGLLLRYLSEIYRALLHTVPDGKKTEALWDVIDWLGAELRKVDASLLEEWQKLSDPARLDAPSNEESLDTSGEDITRDRRAFGLLVRNQVFRWVQKLGRKDFAGLSQIAEEQQLARLAPPNYEELMAPYFTEYSEVRADAEARSAQYFALTPSEDALLASQVLLDPEGDLAYSLRFRVDLEASRAENRVVMDLIGLFEGAAS